MERGELYRVRNPRNDTRPARTFLVVNRQDFLYTSHSTVTCVPVYSRAEGLSTEVAIGPGEGMKYTSFLRCDELTGMQRSLLRDFVGSLSPEKLREVNRALAIALDIDPDDLDDL